MRGEGGCMQSWGCGGGAHQALARPGELDGVDLAERRVSRDVLHEGLVLACSSQTHRLRPLRRCVDQERGTSTAWIERRWSGKGGSERAWDGAESLGERADLAGDGEVGLHRGLSIGGAWGTRMSEQHVNVSEN